MSIYCSKHVEENNRFNKEIVHQVGKQNYILLRCTVNNTLKTRTIVQSMCSFYCIAPMYFGTVTNPECGDSAETCWCYFMNS